MLLQHWERKTSSHNRIEQEILSSGCGGRYRGKQLAAQASALEFRSSKAPLKSQTQLREHWETEIGTSPELTGQCGQSCWRNGWADSLKVESFQRRHLTSIPGLHIRAHTFVSTYTCAQTYTSKYVHHTTHTGNALQSTKTLTCLIRACYRIKKKFKVC